EEVVTGRRRDIRPSFCQSLSHLKITLSLTPFSRAIWATQAPGCDASSTIRSLNSFEYFLRGSFRQSCNSILRCPSVSDGRLSYQFLSNGYIRRSVYAYVCLNPYPVPARLRRSAGRRYSGCLPERISGLCLVRSPGRCLWQRCRRRFQPGVLRRIFWCRLSWAYWGRACCQPGLL